MSGTGRGGIGTSFQAGDQGGPLPDDAGLRGAAGLGGALDPLDGQVHPGEVLQQPGGSRERPGGRDLVVHLREPRGQGRPGHAELGIAGSEPVLAGRAVVPGAVQGDRAEDGVDGPVPVGDELGIMAVPARHPRAAESPVGGQQPPEHPAAQFQQARADHRLGGLHPGIPAAQRPRGFRRQAAYLGGSLLRERPEEPPFSPPIPEGSSPAAPASGAAGRASQIASFTSVT